MMPTLRSPYSAALCAAVLGIALIAGSCSEAVPATARGSEPAASPVVALSFDGEATLGRGMTLVPRPPGVAEIDGVRGRALRFDGSGAKVEVAGIGKHRFADCVTLELWIRPEGDNPVRRSASYMCAAASTAFYVSYSASRNSVEARITTEHGKVRLRGAKGAALQGRWHHVALVADGHTARLYVDGVVTATSRCAGALALRERTRLGIGTWFQSNQAFYGAIDEVAVFDRALSAKEVTERAGVGATAGQ